MMLFQSSGVCVVECCDRFAYPLVQYPVVQFGTWSKALDYTDGEFGVINTVAPLRDWNYGLAGFDRTHILKINWLWSCPHFFSQKPTSLRIRPNSRLSPGTENVLSATIVTTLPVTGADWRTYLPGPGYCCCATCMPSRRTVTFLAGALSCM